MSIKKLFFTFTLLALLLSACNLPNSPASPTPLSADAIFTAAAQTVEAQLTQSAPPPSSTPLPASPTPPESPTPALPTLPPASTLPAAPTIAPAATQSCDKADFIADVTYADDTEVAAGTTFVKTWRLKNSGACAWSNSYQLIFFSGERMNAPAAVSFPAAVAPGQTIDLSVTLTAPSAPNTYTGNFKLRNASGQDFSQVYVRVKVPGATGAGGTAGPLAVTSVVMSSGGSCGAFTISASITANGPGSVTYKWIRSDGGTDTIVHDPLVFTAAGTQTVSTSWAASPPATTLWMEIYIDSPNHQQFGRATFSCP